MSSDPLICPRCTRVIEIDADTAKTPLGTVHARCAKVGKAHGREITRDELPDCLKGE